MLENKSVLFFWVREEKKGGGENLVAKYERIDKN